MTKHRMTSSRDLVTNTFLASLVYDGGVGDEVLPADSEYSSCALVKTPLALLCHCETSGKQALYVSYQAGSELAFVHDNVHRPSQVFVRGCSALFFLEKVDYLF